ncbi:MAG: pyridoxal phosphate-dependent aminotransferase, partial [Flavobacteriaceae bacterium]|nr:pyridoxal phosphate-dependent aminotransferase [Flavobacteriaceae bacterium]
MPQISQKGQQMPASPIRKLVPFAENAEARGIKIHYLNIGQPDIETPSIALDAVKNIDFKTLAYSHSAGFPEYRKKLAASYQSLGLPVNAEEI